MNAETIDSAAPTQADQATAPDLATQLAQAVEELAKVRQQIAELSAKPPAAASKPFATRGAGAMGVETPPTEPARAARAAAETGDRAALMTYLRLKRQGAD